MTKNEEGFVLDLMKQINRAWIEGRYDVLEEFFHDSMVITTPGFQIVGEGKRACVDSYKSFGTRAVIKSLKESGHVIRLWGNTGVVAYQYELDYEMDETEYHDLGTDVYAFSRVDGKWKAVWRTLKMDG